MTRTIAFQSSDTRAAALRRMRHAFAAAGVPTPEVDARRLLQLALETDAADLVLNPARALGDNARALTLAANRRIAREPVSRIAGWRGFHGIELEVSPDTLDPRPDTEALVELALEIAVGQGWRDRPVRIIDFGTGTGCVLLALLAELPLATGIGSDISPAALAVAQRNGERLGLAGRVGWIEADGLEPLQACGPFDLLVSNPPYIPSDDIPELEPEVRDFDPLFALDGGRDGLDWYRHLIANAAACVPQGWMAVEVGTGQAADVVEMLKLADSECCPDRARTRKDLGGHIRSVAWKPQNQTGIIKLLAGGQVGARVGHGDLNRVRGEQ
ncbi:MAG: peptide chain release factor N(5)-glutamine methyltransferase [Hyphomicrobiaceae bacterium]